MIHVSFVSPLTLRGQDLSFIHTQSPFGQVLIVALKPKENDLNISEYMSPPSLVFLGFCPLEKQTVLLTYLDQKWHPRQIIPDSFSLDHIVDLIFNSYLNEISTINFTQKDNSNPQDSLLNLILCGTPFQHRVWNALCSIPRGQCTTYGAVSKKLNSHPRAVGGAIGRNPISYLVPCHRVLASNQTLNGYRWGLSVKEKLLRAEGVALKSSI